MIESLFFIADNKKQAIDFSWTNAFKVAINLPKKTNSFDIEINFSESCVSFRNHDYSWVDLTQNRIAGAFCSKILKLLNGKFVQPSQNVGIWCVNAQNPKQLIWKFNPEFSNPITEYSGKNNIKKIVAANSVLEINSLELLFSTSALELSRSKIPFSAIACFTDHCDYDTLSNLQMQREFFKKLNLKTTKGFFLNHFSKRKDNASVENDKAELQKWIDDQHELCYHSLSQSIKTDEQSWKDFTDFQAPFENVTTWIDHGFQPYNFSLYKNNSKSDDYFESVLTKNKIKILWNYIDCGMATNGVINQLNSNQFTLNKYWNSIKKMPFKSRMVKLIKAIIFHYDNDKNRVRNYIDSISAIRQLVKNKNLLAIFSFIRNISPVTLMVLKSLLSWNSIKNKPFKVALYTPVIFNHKINHSNFVVFQTLELVDFSNGLSKSNIDLLMKENGLLIAHTYFSVDMKHHHGKLIKNDNQFNEDAVQNFEYLALKIKEGSIWNPLLSELIAFLTDFTATIFDVDEKGTIFIKNNFDIPFTNIND